MKSETGAEIVPLLGFDAYIDHDSTWVEYDYYPNAPLHFNRVDANRAPEKDICGTITKSVGLNFFDKGATPSPDYVLSVTHRAVKGLRTLAVHEEARLADLEPFRLARSWYANIDKHRAYWCKDKRYSRRDDWNDSQKRERERRITETERLRLLGVKQREVAVSLGVTLGTVKAYCAVLADKYGKDWIAKVEASKAKAGRRIQKAKQSVSRVVSHGHVLLHGDSTLRHEGLESESTISLESVIDSGIDLLSEKFERLFHRLRLDDMRTAREFQARLRTKAETWRADLERHRIIDKRIAEGRHAKQATPIRAALEPGTPEWTDFIFNTA